MSEVAETVLIDNSLDSLIQLFKSFIEKEFTTGNFLLIL